MINSHSLSENHDLILVASPFARTLLIKYKWKRKRKRKRKAETEKLRLENGRQHSLRYALTDSFCACAI